MPEPENDTRYTLLGVALGILVITLYSWVSHAP